MSENNHSTQEIKPSNNINILRHFNISKVFECLKIRIIGGSFKRYYLIILRSQKLNNCLLILRIFSKLYFPFLRYLTSV